MTRDSDTRRMAETGTGSVRSTGSAVPNGQSPNSNVIPSSDLDALVEKIEEAIEVHEGHCLSYVSFYPDTARRFATAITSLRNQLTASEARERELREALEACLSREQERAEVYGLSDCTCISLSRNAEREYETGTCPHQRGRTALSKTENRHG